MREVIGWDDYFFGLAHEATKRSKDPSTQVGAVIVDKNRDIVSTGYNGMGENMAEMPEVWERPLKYDLVIHSELNAIGRAARAGKATDGSTIYVTHFPCNDCAKAIVAAGIRRLVVGPPVRGWDEAHVKARATLTLNQIEIVQKDRVNG